MKQMNVNQETKKKPGSWSTYFSRLTKIGRRIKKCQMPRQAGPERDKKNAEGVTLINEREIF